VISAKLIRLLLFGVIAFGIRVSVAADAFVLKYDDLKTMITEKNERVLAAKKEMEGASTRTGHLGRTFLPTIQGSVGFESYRTNGAAAGRSGPVGDVGANFNLFQGGRDSLEENARQAELRLAEAEHQKTLGIELSKARKEYWQLLYLRESAQVFIEAIEMNNINLASAQKRASAGIATGIDRLEFEMNRNQLEQESARLQILLENTQRTLALALGLPAETEIQATEKIPFQQDDRIMNVTLDSTHHPSVKSSMSLHEMESARADALKQWWLPSLDLYGTYSLYPYRDREFEALSDRYEGVVGLKLTFKIFDGLVSSSEGSAARLRSEAQFARATLVGRESLSHFESLKKELKLLSNLVRGAEDNVQLSSKYLTGTLSEYKRGVKNSADVLMASQRFVELRKRFSELRRDYQSIRAELLSYLGE